MLNNKQLSDRRWRRSFTFIEMLAAIALLEVATVSGLMLFSFSNRTTTVIKENLVVTNLLQAKVEEIQCRDFNTDVSGMSLYPTYSQYFITVSQVVPYLSNSYLKKITVTCQWTSALGVAKQDSVVFLVSKN